MNGFDIVNSFENELAKYTGAKYAIAVDSCSNALFLSLKYLMPPMEIIIPSNTYVSVPMSIINAGHVPVLDTSRNDWEETYELFPTNIEDSALLFKRNMYKKGKVICLSFHSKKTLKLGKGGAILTDDEKTYKLLKKAAYSGRSGVSIYEEDITDIGYNMYMPHQIAALGLSLLQDFPEVTETIKPEYRDLTTFKCFKHIKTI